MPVSEEFLSYIIGQLTEWGGVTSRKMFGGAGLFRDGKMFALISDDTAYLRADESNREQFDQADSRQFKPYEKRKGMPYFEVPPAVLESPAELINWSKRSLAIQKKK